MNEQWSSTVSVDARNPVVDAEEVFRAFIQYRNSLEREGRAKHRRRSKKKRSHASKDKHEDDSHKDGGVTGSITEEDEEDPYDHEGDTDDDDGNGEKGETESSSDAESEDDEGEEEEDEDDYDDNSAESDEDSDDYDNSDQEAMEDDDKKMTPEERTKMLAEEMERVKRSSNARTAPVIRSIIARINDPKQLAKDLKEYDMTDSFIDDEDIVEVERKRPRNDGSKSDSKQKNKRNRHGIHSSQGGKKDSRHGSAKSSQSQDVDDPDALGLNLPEPVRNALQEYRNCIIYEKVGEKTRKALETKQKTIQAIYDAIQSGCDKEELIDNVVDAMSQFIEQNNLKRNLKRSLKILSEEMKGSSPSSSSSSTTTKTARPRREKLKTEDVNTGGTSGTSPRQ